MLHDTICAGGSSPSVDGARQPAFVEAARDFRVKAARLLISSKA
jgi:hypothetical protein